MIALLRFFLHGFLIDETLAGYMPKNTVWQLTEMDGVAVSAHQTAPYPWIRIERLVATKRACPNLALETRYLTQLQSMTLSEISGPVLLLSTETGDTLAFRTAD